jgi:drug/metabolite transporter (DMT)-like permease
MRLKADLLLFLIAIIWGTAFVAQRIAGEQNIVYLFNGVRYLLASLVVLPFVKRKESLPRAQWKWMMIAGLVLFMGSALQQVGIVYTSAGNAGFITSLYVVLIPLILIIFWRENLHWLAIVAAVLASIGAFLLSTGGSFVFRTGDILELVGALFWAFHVIVLGKFASRYDAMSFSVGQLAICGFLNLGIGIFVEPIHSLTNISLLAAIIYTAVFSLGIAYTLQIWAQRHTPPSDAALILGLESVFSVLSGWIILHENLAALQIAGCGLILLAVLLSQLKQWNTSSKIESESLVEGR